MRAALQTHPKVVRIMSALEADRLRVIGGLHAVWCLFDTHSEDGKLRGYTAEIVDTLIGWAGFARAMLSVSWLEEEDGSLVAPRFDEHNGQSAKRRAGDAERKRNVRKMSAKCPQPMRTKSGPEKEKEKEKEVNKKQAPDKPARFDPLALPLPDCLSKDDWKRWIDYRRGGKMTVREPTVRAQIKKLEDWHASGQMPAAIIDQSITSGWTGLFELKTNGGNNGKQSRHEHHAELAAELTGKSSDRARTIDGTATKVD